MMFADWSLKVTEIDSEKRNKVENKKNTREAVLSPDFSHLLVGDQHCTNVNININKQSQVSHCLFIR